LLLRRRRPTKSSEDKWKKQVGIKDIEDKLNAAKDKEKEKALKAKEKVQQLKLKEKAKKEARKNSGAPKRPTSAFWLWQTENREALVKEAGTTKIPVIGKLAGEKWGKMSAASKAPFEKRAETAKAEYTKALEEWKASNPDAEPEKDDAEDEEESSPPAKKAKRAGA